MSGAYPHYRLSMIGEDLKETLEEFEERDMFDKQHTDIVLDHFDRAMADALATQVRSKAVINGRIKHYRNHDDIWRIRLSAIDMQLNGKGISSKNETEIIAVTKR